MYTEELFKMIDFGVEWCVLDGSQILASIPSLAFLLFELKTPLNSQCY